MHEASQHRHIRVFAVLLVFPILEADASHLALRCAQTMGPFAESSSRAVEQLLVCNSLGEYVPCRCPHGRRMRQCETIRV